MPTTYRASEPACRANARAPVRSNALNARITPTSEAAIAKLASDRIPHSHTLSLNGNVSASAPRPGRQERSSRRVLARAGWGVGVRAREVRIAPRPRARWRAGHPTTPEGGAIVPAGLMARLSPLGLWAREFPAPPSRRGKHLAVGERSARAWLAHLEEEGLETGGGEYHDALAGLGTNVGAAVRNAGRDVRRVPRAERDASPLDLHLKASGQHLNSLRLVRVPVRWQAPPSRRLVDQEAELPIAVGR